MKDSNNLWRFVLKIVGLSLVAAGLICLLIGFWDKLAGDISCLKSKLCRGSCSEFDDYDDDLMFE